MAKLSVSESQIDEELYSMKQLLLDLNLVIPNDYLDKYLNLIETNLDNKYVKFKTCRHHIIPRYYYKINNLPINNTKTNIVYLSYANHILAHYYLALCSSCGLYRFYNEEAVSFTLGTMPENEKLILDESTNLDLLEQQRRKDFSVYMPRHTWTDEEKAKIAQKIKETKQINNYKYIHKDGIITCIPKIYLETYLNSGWLLGTGRTYSASWNANLKNCYSNETIVKMQNSHRGKKWMYLDSITEEQIGSDLITTYLAAGWRLGRADSSKKMISKGSIGKLGTFNGKHHTEKTKQAIGKKNTSGKYVNKDGVVKHISINELDVYLLDGWKLGNPNANAKNKYVWVSNGIITKHILRNDLQDYLNNGYHQGRK